MSRYIVKLRVLGGLLTHTVSVEAEHVFSDRLGHTFHNGKGSGHELVAYFQHADVVSIIKENDNG